MAAYRAIRVQLPDRPGALSNLSAALAAHRVDIIRLDVVSHEGSTVVDDLFVCGESQEDIGAAVGSFWPDVAVRTFEDLPGDPALEMGIALESCAVAPDAAAMRDALLGGVRRLLRADRAALYRARPDFGFSLAGGPAMLPEIQPSERFAGRWVMQHGAAAFPASSDWGSPALRESVGGAWIAAAPIGAGEVVLVIRDLNIAFYHGELDRLAVFSSAAGALLRLFGEPAPLRAMATDAEISLPAKAVTVLNHVRVA